MCEQDADCITSTSKCSCAEWNPCYIESKNALSVEKSPENNMLSIVLIISIPSGYYTLWGWEEKLQCGFRLSQIFSSVSSTNASLLSYSDER